MTSMLVVDASFVAALLSPPDEALADWAGDQIDGAELAAPHLMHVEVASVLRRAERQGQLSAESASAALRDLIDLGVDLYPFEPFAADVWSLRHTVSSYDAWYLALAERLDAPLATLDRRLARAGTAGHSFVLPPD